MITTETELDLKQFVEGGDGISVIRGGGSVRGWNGIRYRAGLSRKNVGAKKLSMNVATIPAGGVAYAHIHVDFGDALHLQGRVRHSTGRGSESSRTRPAISSSSSPACPTKCST